VQRCLRCPSESLLTLQSTDLHIEWVAVKTTVRASA
jgi:hypothetical protein